MSFAKPRQNQKAKAKIFLKVMSFLQKLIKVNRLITVVGVLCFDSVILYILE
jgi:hypothetical protein